jgi:hypothetical protein
MGQPVSFHSPGPRSAAALLLCGAVFVSGCALLIPPSWRGRAPIPLAGSIEPEDANGSRDASPIPGELSPADASIEQLRLQVDADQRRLVELASRPGGGPLADEASEAELHQIADRLPRLQRELERRGAGEEGGRTRQPVIR